MGNFKSENHDNRKPRKRALTTIYAMDCNACDVLSADALLQWDHKNVILLIIKDSLSLFAFSLSWQLPGGCSGRNLPLGGGSGPPGLGCDICDMVTGPSSARGRCLWPSHQWTEICQRYPLLVIYSNHQNTRASRYISRWWLLIFPVSVPTHARSC